MKLKGNMKIELMDVNTSQVQVIEKSNMLTEAVNNIFGLNPMGIFYKVTGEYDKAVTWNEKLLPICPNMIGGILLFPDSLDERTDNIYQYSGNMPVGYASNDVNDTTDLMRGSLNLNESGPLEKGYKFVWEFTVNQGNGTIAAVALTSALGGQHGFGNRNGDASPFLLLKKTDMTLYEEDVSKMLCQAVEMDFEKEMVVSISMEDSKVVIRKIRVPVFSIGLNEKLDDSVLSIIEEKEVTVSTFNFRGDYIKYGDFFDGKDGYWYGFSNEENTSGDCSMYWVKISKEDYTVTEGEWNLTEACLHDVGNCRWDSGYPEKVGKACIRDGYLYVPAYDWSGVYKINVSNSADVELIDLGFVSQGIPVSEPGSCERYLVLIGDIIVGGDFQILADDAVIETAGEQKFNYLATPLFQYKNYLFGWGGSYGVDNRSVYLLTPYLATINNLESAVVKSSDKTMKITYTLTQE